MLFKIISYLIYNVIGEGKAIQLFQMGTLPSFSIPHIRNKNKHFFMFRCLAMSELTPAMLAAHQRVFHSEGLWLENRFVF